jgi:hypothetical protein
MSFFVMIKLKSIRFMYVSQNGMVLLSTCWMRLALQVAHQGERP